MASVSLACGHVMGTMTAETTAMRTNSTAHSILVVLTNSGVPMVGAYSDHGSAIMKMTAETVQMSWIVIIHHAPRKTSHVLTIVVYPCHRSAMA